MFSNSPRPSAPKTNRLFRVRALLVGLMGALTLSACSSTSLKTPSPSVTLEEIRVAKFDQDGIDLTITLLVNNPSSLEMPLEDLKASVILQDIAIAEASASQPTFMLRAGQQVQLPLKGRILFKPLGQALKASPLALVSGKTEVIVRGSATTSYGLIPLRFERRLKLEPLAR